MEPLGTGKLAAALGALVIDKLYPSTGTSNLIHWVMASACDRYIESVFRDVCRVRFDTSIIVIRREVAQAAST